MYLAFFWRHRYRYTHLLSSWSFLAPLSIVPVSIYVIGYVYITADEEYLSSNSIMTLHLLRTHCNDIKGQEDSATPTFSPYFKTYGRSMV